MTVNFPWPMAPPCVGTDIDPAIVISFSNACQCLEDKQQMIQLTKVIETANSNHIHSIYKQIAAWLRGIGITLFFISTFV